MKLNVKLTNSSQTNFRPDIILMTFTILGGNELKCPSFDQPRLLVADDENPSKTC